MDDVELANNTGEGLFVSLTGAGSYTGSNINSHDNTLADVTP